MRVFLPTVSLSAAGVRTNILAAALWVAPMGTNGGLLVDEYPPLSLNLKRRGVVSLSLPASPFVKSAMPSRPRTSPSALGCPTVEEARILRRVDTAEIGSRRAGRLQQVVEQRQGAPVSGEFLDLIRGQEESCANQFDEWIPSAGARAPATVQALGTALSLLERIGSCWWGCRGGDHQDEYLVGRAASNAKAALLLLRTGYYDEALGLVRQVGETSNLIALFVQSADLHAKWRSAGDADRRREFSPVNVRKGLQSLEFPLPIDSEMYGLLSGRAVHPHSEHAPQSHNVDGRPTQGAVFQEAGALVVLNELAGQVGYLIGLAQMFVGPQPDGKAVFEAALDLIESVGKARLKSMEEYFERVRSQIGEQTVRAPR
ncbi:MAG: hypothetical protein OXE43_14500 [Chloroflexi bacterium]|nr:hypothetical protein [Chloroflexota bacterium]